MLIKLIKPLYNLSDEMHLYDCSPVNITFAVGKSVNLVKILKKLSIRLQELEIGYCFDSVEIIQPQEERIKEEYNPMLLNLKNLNKIENIDKFINGCDKQQVIDLFNMLKQ